ncbi:hypothetical protein I317_02054 [Kwoniella heveanensis CBS 569]|nr:hypothetical protein I317_02054 [Kwoniella heveanensis CBS 569]
MPTESALPTHNPSPTSSPSPANIKCAICGVGNSSFTSTTSASSSSPSTVAAFEGEVVILSDPIRRLCGRCVATSGGIHSLRGSFEVAVDEAQGERHDIARECTDSSAPTGLGLRGVPLGDESGTVSADNIDADARAQPRGSAGNIGVDVIDHIASRSPSPESDANPSPGPSPGRIFSQSLPAHPTLPWMTTSSASAQPSVVDAGAGKPLGSAESGSIATPPHTHRTHHNATQALNVKENARSALEERERVPNPLLDVTSVRTPSIGRGALYPGSVFKGSQTSGRSAYEVEIRLLNVNFAASSVSGYLSISHLTDTHPHLTTFFDGEIIGPHHGFITGTRFGATEHDDMRHWGRFEQFRRPSTRADMVRPELFFRDPLPDRSKGETRAKERDFVFLRIKEKFLVPDHKVRDISGASFAGFYYAMVDLSPSVTLNPEPPSTPTSPTTPKLPLNLSYTYNGITTTSASAGISATTSNSATAPMFIRRASSTNDASGSGVVGASGMRRPEGQRRRESSNRLREPKEVRGEATIRGYYFHSLNQEPFQELFLTHIPQRSSSIFEFR